MATYAARTDGGAVDNGDVVYIQNAATGFVLYEITAIGNADASFTHSSAQNNGQTPLLLARVDHRDV